MTWIAGVPSRCSRLRTSAASRSRRSRSSAPNGSSSSSSRGRGASARASATRWASPPDSVATERDPWSGELDQLEQLGDPRGPLGSRDARRREAVRDVARDVEVREEQGVLEDQPEAPPVRGRRRQVDAVPATPARVRREQPGDHPQQRGLAGPARAEQRHDLRRAPTSQVHVRRAAARCRRTATTSDDREPVAAPPGPGRSQRPCPLGAPAVGEQDHRRR